MAKKTTKKIDLATAKVADGELKAPVSVYEICGISENAYGTTSFESYKKKLASMNLIQLQDHAFKIGALATQDRSVLIDRLERKFLQDTARLRATGQKKADSDPTAANREQALQILARGR